MNRKSPWYSALSIALGCGMILIAASDLQAQRGNRGKGTPPKVKPPWGHDRSGLPPRRVLPPHANANASLSYLEDGLGGAASASTITDVATSLRAGTLISPGKTAIPPSAQYALLELLTGAEAARTPLALHLATPENRGAQKEALVLVDRLHGLFDAPSGLREAVIAYNTLVDVSSAEFLNDPSPEFLAIQAALKMLVLTVRPVDSRSDPD